MVFASGTYYAFLIAVFFVYWTMAKRIQWRLACLVVAGCFFYLVVGGRGILLLAAVSVVDYTTTRLMVRSSDSGHRKRLLLVSLAIDLGALCIFKYANFFVESLAGALSLVGANPDFHFNVAAPIGASFFIFQSLAYVVDVYRSDTEPSTSYLDYLAFVSFFPTIVAGPILRARQLLPQLRSSLKLDGAAGGRALFLIGIGLIKKIAVADYLSANLVDRVFDFPERFSSLEVLAAVYGYALQVYADFSGYSDIAIGSAMLLGFSLPANFDAPYRARNLPEFWRRWHISLSTWLRDYVFFSIAGKRARSAAVLYCALAMTMLIGGLWHGPAWTFVLWGLLHGLGLIASRAWMNLRKRHKLERRTSRWAQGASLFLTFHFVCFTWIFFRGESVGQAVSVLTQLSTLTWDTSNLALPVVSLIPLGFLAHGMPDRFFEIGLNAFARLPAAAQACLLFALALGLYFVASSDVVPFIYSRF